MPFAKENTLIFNTKVEFPADLREYTMKNNIKFFTIVYEIENCKSKSDIHWKLIKFLLRRHIPNDQLCYFQHTFDDLDD